MAFEIAPAPTMRERVKELLVERFGWPGCRHDYRIMQMKDGTHKVRCWKCTHESEPFRMLGDRKKA